jgi:hypothetical protein
MSSKSGILICKERSYFGVYSGVYLYLYQTSDDTTPEDYINLKNSNLRKQENGFCIQTLKKVWFF